MCLPHGWPPLGGGSRRRRVGERALRYTKFRMKMRSSPSVRYADSSLTEEPFGMAMKTRYVLTPCRTACEL